MTETAPVLTLLTWPKEVLIMKLINPAIGAGCLMNHHYESTFFDLDSALVVSRQVVVVVRMRT